MAYTINVTLNFTDAQSTPAAADHRQGATDDRQALADDLLNELTSWSPRERFGTLKSWHRGALSLIHLNVLTVLEAQGPLSMSRLAEALDVSDASATGIVTRMERRGLVDRQHATDDRRIVVVRLTDCGADVFRDLDAHRRERLAGLVAQLTGEELAGFLTGLRAMRAAGRRLSETHDAAGEPAAPGLDQPSCADERTVQGGSAAIAPPQD
jgi:DNA-binding MarR family transcriptional regulator